MDTVSNESRGTAEPSPGELFARPQGSVGPGQRIRDAREQAGLSLGELATQLRLTVPTLVALEGDDFSTLKEPVYVRGYYRKCAKLLPLNAAELIAAYDRLAVPKAAAAAVPSKLLLASSESDSRDPRAWLRWLIIVVLLLVVAAVVGRMFSRHEHAAAVSQTTSVMPAASQEAGAAAAGMPEGAAQKAAESPAPANPLPAQAVASGAASPLPSAPPAPQAAPAPAATKPIAENSSRLPINASSGVAPSTPAAAAASQAEAGGAALVLEFRDQSWAEVFDASGKRLLSGMMHAGAHESLVGKLPYSVFLGNAPKVDVSYGGQHVDLGGRVRDNATARFQIPLN